MDEKMKMFAYRGYGRLGCRGVLSREECRASALGSIRPAAWGRPRWVPDTEVSPLTERRDVEMPPVVRRPLRNAADGTERAWLLGESYNACDLPPESPMIPVRTELPMDGESFVCAGHPSIMSENIPNISGPLPSRAAYDSAATFYDRRKWMRFWKENEKPIVLKNLLGDPTNWRILDLGCGTGFYGVDLARMGNEIWGIDISEQMLHQFENKLERHLNAESTNVHLVCSDAQSLPICSNYFDACLAVRTLSHIEAIDVVFDEVYRVLRPGGVMLIVDIHSEHLYGVTTLEHPDSHVKIPVVTYKRPPEVYLQTAKSSGFEHELYSELYFSSCSWKPLPGQGFDKILNHPDNPILFFSKLRKTG